MVKDVRAQLCVRHAPLGALSLILLLATVPLRRTSRHARRNVQVLTLCVWGIGAQCQGWQLSGKDIPSKEVTIGVQGNVVI